jgi:Na+-driven multidrug efflux pump
LADGSKTRDQLDREAARLFHALPLMVLALGVAVVGAYIAVGDTMYLLVGSVIAFWVYQISTIRFAARHAVLQPCRGCERLRGNGFVTGLFVWYCHRRIWDGKAVLVLGVLGIIVSVIYDAIGKAHALLPFLVGYELIIMQLAMFLRSVTVHRGNEATCRLCAAGDDAHSDGRITESDLKG